MSSNNNYSNDPSKKKKLKTKVKRVTEREVELLINYSQTCTQTALDSLIWQGARSSASTIGRHQCHSTQRI